MFKSIWPNKIRTIFYKINLNLWQKIKINESKKWASYKWLKLNTLEFEWGKFKKDWLNIGKNRTKKEGF